MNNNDQPQSVKDMYRVPTTLSETVSFGMESPEQAPPEIDRQLDDSIIHDEAPMSFEQITKELAVSASSGESPDPVTGSAEFETNPHAVEILQMSHAITEVRTQRHAELVARRKRFIRNVITTLFGANSTPMPKPGSSEQTTIGYLAELEDSKVGQTTFPINRKIEPEIKNRRFIFLPEGDDVIWYMKQTSTVKAKNFTNSYKVRPHLVEKSSTFFDETLGRDRNVAVVAGEDEVLTLKAAVTHYHSEVIKKIYTQPVGPKNRTKSSGPRGRTK